MMNPNYYFTLLAQSIVPCTVNRYVVPEDTQDPTVKEHVMPYMRDNFHKTSTQVSCDGANHAFAARMRILRVQQR